MPDAPLQSPPQPPAPESKGLMGMFGGTKPAAANADSRDLLERTNDISSRLRLGEERHTELRKKLLFIEQQMLALKARQQQDIKHLQEDVAALRTRLLEVEDRIITVIKEVRLLAKKEDVEIVRKYQEMWNPVKFVTADRIDGLVQEAVERCLRGKDSPQDDEEHRDQWGPH